MNDERVISAKEPTQCQFEEGKTYAWCACGRSAKQPYCDGAHSSTGIKPMIVKADTNRAVWLCQCKQTKNPPYCDGSHKNC